MTCKLCNERGKTWSGDDPKCAFKDNLFTTDNWNCATMNELRRISDEIETKMRNDMSCASVGIVPLDNDYLDYMEYENVDSGYIVMTWYKERGRTGNALIMWDEQVRPLTELEAVAVIEAYKVWGKRK